MAEYQTTYSCSREWTLADHQLQLEPQKANPYCAIIKWTRYLNLRDHLAECWLLKAWQSLECPKAVPWRWKQWLIEKYRGGYLFSRPYSHARSAAIYQSFGQKETIYPAEGHMGGSEVDLSHGRWSNNREWSIWHRLYSKYARYMLCLICHDFMASLTELVWSFTEIIWVSYAGVASIVILYRNKKKFTLNNIWINMK